MSYLFCVCSPGHDQHPGEEAGLRAALRPLRLQCRGLQQGHRGSGILQGNNKLIVVTNVITGLGIRSFDLRSFALVDL